MAASSGAPFHPLGECPLAPHAASSFVSIGMGRGPRRATLDAPAGSPVSPSCPKVFSPFTLPHATRRGGFPAGERYLDY